jgi:phosphoserine phosphatase
MAENNDHYKSDINSWNPQSEARLEDFFGKIKTGIIKKPVAVFDADGTLWQNDVGEGFFMWLIKNKKLVGVDYSKDIYKEYETILAKEPDKAFSMAVAIMAGIKEDDLKIWAEEHFDTFKNNVYPKQKELIKKLQDAGVDVWIVSASNKWSVDAGAKYMGIDSDHVIAMNVKVLNGKLTDELLPPVLHGPGKVEAIKKYIGNKIDFVCGNSMSDYDMLAFSSSFSLIINPSEKIITIGDNKNTSLLKESKKNGWTIQKWDNF